MRVYRRVFDERVLVADVICTTGTADLLFPDHAKNFRQYGVLSLEVTPVDRPVIWKATCWFVDASVPAAGVALVFCTFNREHEITCVLQSIASDAALVRRLSRIYLVNQGEPLLSSEFSALRQRYGEKLEIIVQANFGGAGGFTRGLIEALDNPTITHTVFLDDDIEVEPDSLFRMVSFFDLAKTDIVIGGQMLDGA
ncbi:glycosyltransferase family 2 protein [Acidisphaera sp. L21]|uniref:glycosyltransferase family 2 protein n=1 Tax=Acidisphaera sp. L21 TaxID=1641851 RepID=UPI001C2046B6|nr:glycosyltransferase [Acidisphaera sp. L21]